MMMKMTLRNMRIMVKTMRWNMTMMMMTLRMMMMKLRSMRWTMATTNSYFDSYVQQR